MDNDFQLTDRYGLSTTFSFDATQESTATMGRITTHAKNLERALVGLNTAANGKAESRIASLSAQIKSFQTSVSAGADQIGASTAKAANQIMQFSRRAARDLRPLKEQFRAIKAEAANIDFGDLSKGGKSFSEATRQIKRYRDELKQLASQVEGNSAIEREFTAQIERQQDVLKRRMDMAKEQRKAIRYSEKAGGFAMVSQVSGAIANPANDFLKDALDVKAGLDDTIASINAVTNGKLEVDDAINRMRGLAVDLGATTRYNAKDAADAMLIIAQAGYDTESALAGATKEVLAFAASSDLEMPRAADIAISSLNQFKLGIEDLSHVSDVMAYASAAANLGATELGESLKYAGPVAKQMGQGLETTVAIISAMSQAGIKGSDAGTAARALFGRPATAGREKMEELGISTVDSQGNMRDTIDVLYDLKAALDKLPTMDKTKYISDIFGVPAESGVGALLDQIDFAKELRDKTDLASSSFEAGGAAAKMMERRERSLAGATRNLESAMEGLKIDVADVMGGFANISRIVKANVLTAFHSLPKPIRNVAIAVGLATVSIAGLISVASSLASQFFFLKLAASTANISFLAFSRGMIPLTGFFSEAIAAIGIANPFTMSLKLLGTTSRYTGMAFAGLNKSIATFSAIIIRSALSPMGLTLIALSGIYAVLQQMYPQVNLVGAAFNTILGPISFGIGFLSGLIKGLASHLNFIAPVVNQIKQPFEHLAEATSQIIQTMRKMGETGEMVGQAIGDSLGLAISTPFKIATEMISGLWSNLIANLADKMNQLLPIARDVGMGLVSRLAKNSPGPIAWIEKKWTEFTQWMANLWGKLSDSASQAGKDISQGFTKYARAGLMTAISFIAIDLSAAFVEKFLSNLKAVGRRGSKNAIASFLGVGSVVKPLAEVEYRISRVQARAKYLKRIGLTFLNWSLAINEFRLALNDSTPLAERFFHLLTGSIFIAADLVGRLSRSVLVLSKRFEFLKPLAGAIAFASRNLGLMSFVIVGLSLALQAYQSNFLGVRSAVENMFPYEQVQEKWGGTLNSIAVQLDQFAGRAKQTGQQLVSYLAENSPGPLVLIRDRWSRTLSILGVMVGGFLLQVSKFGKELPKAFTLPAITKLAGKLFNLYGILQLINDSVTGFKSALTGDFTLFGHVLIRISATLLSLSPLLLAGFGPVGIAIGQVVGKLGMMMLVLEGLRVTVPRFASLISNALGNPTPIKLLANAFVVLGGVIDYVYSEISKTFGLDGKIADFFYTLVDVVDYSATGFDRLKKSIASFFEAYRNKPMSWAVPDFAQMKANFLNFVALIKKNQAKSVESGTPELGGIGTVLSGAVSSTASQALGWFEKIVEATQSTHTAIAASAMDANLWGDTMSHQTQSVYAATQKVTQGLQEVAKQADDAQNQISSDNTSPQKRGLIETLANNLRETIANLNLTGLAFLGVASLAAAGLPFTTAAVPAVARLLIGIGPLLVASLAKSGVFDYIQSRFVAIIQPLLLKAFGPDLTSRIAEAAKNIEIVIRGTLNAIINSIPGVLSAIAAQFAFVSAIKGISNLGDALKEVGQLFGFVGNAINSILRAVNNTIVKIALAFGTIAEVIDYYLSQPFIVPEPLKPILRAIGRISAGLAGFFGNLSSSLTRFISEGIPRLLRGVLGLISTISTVLLKGLQAVIRGIAAFSNRFLAPVYQLLLRIPVLGKAIAAISAPIYRVLSAIAQAILTLDLAPFFNAIEVGFTAAFSFIVSQATRIGPAIFSAIAAGIGTIGAFGAQAINTIIPKIYQVLLNIGGVMSKILGVITTVVQYPAQLLALIEANISEIVSFITGPLLVMLNPLTFLTKKSRQASRITAFDLVFKGEKNFLANKVVQLLMAKRSPFVAGMQQVEALEMIISKGLIPSLFRGGLTIQALAAGLELVGGAIAGLTLGMIGLGAAIYLIDPNVFYAVRDAAIGLTYVFASLFTQIQPVIDIFGFQIRVPQWAVTAVKVLKTIGAIAVEVVKFVGKVIKVIGFLVANLFQVTKAIFNPIISFVGKSFLTMIAGIVFAVNRALVATEFILVKLRDYIRKITFVLAMNNGNILATIKQLGMDLIYDMRNLLVKGWNATVVQMAQIFYKGLIQPVVSSVLGTFAKLREGVESYFSGLGDAAQQGPLALIHYIFDPVFKGIQAAYDQSYKVILRFLEILAITRAALTFVPKMMSYLPQVLAGIGVAIAAISSPVGAIIAAVSGLTAFLVYEIKDGAREIDLVIQALQNPIKTTQDLFDALTESITKNWDVIGDIFNTIGQGVKIAAIVGFSFLFISKLVKNKFNVFSALTETFKTLITVVKELPLTFRRASWSFERFTESAKGQAITKSATLGLAKGTGLLRMSGMSPEAIQAMEAEVDILSAIAKVEGRFKKLDKSLGHGIDQEVNQFLAGNLKAKDLSVVTVSTLSQLVQSYTGKALSQEALQSDAFLKAKIESLKETIDDDKWFREFAGDIGASTALKAVAKESAIEEFSQLGRGEERRFLPMGVKGVPDDLAEAAYKASGFEQVLKKHGNLFPGITKEYLSQAKQGESSSPLEYMARGRYYFNNDSFDYRPDFGDALQNLKVIRSKKIEIDSIGGISDTARYAPVSSDKDFLGIQMPRTIADHLNERFGVNTFQEGTPYGGINNEILGKMIADVRPGSPLNSANIRPEDKPGIIAAYLSEQGFLKAVDRSGNLTNNTATSLRELLTPQEIETHLRNYFGQSQGSWNAEIDAMINSLLDPTESIHVKKDSFGTLMLGSLSALNAANLDASLLPPDIENDMEGLINSFKQSDSKGNGVKRLADALYKEQLPEAFGLPDDSIKIGVPSTELSASINAAKSAGEEVQYYNTSLLGILQSTYKNLTQDLFNFSSDQAKNGAIARRFNRKRDLAQNMKRFQAFAGAAKSQNMNIGSLLVASGVTSPQIADQVIGAASAQYEKLAAFDRVISEASKKIQDPAYNQALNQDPDLREAASTARLMPYLNQLLHGGGGGSVPKDLTRDQLIDIAMGGTVPHEAVTKMAAHPNVPDSDIKRFVSALMQGVKDYAVSIAPTGTSTKQALTNLFDEISAKVPGDEENSSRVGRLLKLAQVAKNISIDGISPKSLQDVSQFAKQKIIFSTQADGSFGTVTSTDKMLSQALKLYDEIVSTLKAKNKLPDGFSSIADIFNENKSDQSVARKTIIEKMSALARLNLNLNDSSLSSKKKQLSTQLSTVLGQFLLGTGSGSGDSVPAFTPLDQFIDQLRYEGMSKQAILKVAPSLGMDADFLLSPDLMQSSIARAKVAQLRDRRIRQMAGVDKKASAVDIYRKLGLSQVRGGVTSESDVYNLMSGMGSRLQPAALDFLAASSGFESDTHPDGLKAAEKFLISLSAEQLINELPLLEKIGFRMQVFGSDLIKVLGVMDEIERKSVGQYVNKKLKASIKTQEQAQAQLEQAIRQDNEMRAYVVRELISFSGKTEAELRQNPHLFSALERYKQFGNKIAVAVSEREKNELNELIKVSTKAGKTPVTVDSLVKRLAKAQGINNLDDGKFYKYLNGETINSGLKQALDAQFEALDIDQLRENLSDTQKRILQKAAEEAFRRKAGQGNDAFSFSNFTHYIPDKEEVASIDRMFFGQSEDRSMTLKGFIEKTQASYDPNSTGAKVSRFFSQTELMMSSMATNLASLENSLGPVGAVFYPAIASISNALTLFSKAGKRINKTIAYVGDIQRSFKNAESLPDKVITQLPPVIKNIARARKRYRQSKEGSLIDMLDRSGFSNIGEFVSTFEQDLARNELIRSASGGTDQGVAIQTSKVIRSLLQETELDRTYLFGSLPTDTEAQKKIKNTAVSIMKNLLSQSISSSEFDKLMNTKNLYQLQGSGSFSRYMIEELGDISHFLLQSAFDLQIGIIKAAFHTGISLVATFGKGAMRQGFALVKQPLMKVLGASLNMAFSAILTPLATILPMGMFNNIQASLEKLGFDSFKVVESIEVAIDNAVGPIEALARYVEPKSKTLANVIRKAGAGLVRFLNVAVKSVLTVGGALFAINLAPITTLSVAGVAAVGFLVTRLKVVQNAIASIKQVWQSDGSILDKVKRSAGLLIRLPREVGNSIGQVVMGAYDVVKGSIRTVQDIYAGQGLVGLVNLLISGISGLFGTIGQGIKNAFESLNRARINMGDRIQSFARSKLQRPGDFENPGNANKRLISLTRYKIVDGKVEAQQQVKAVTTVSVRALQAIEKVGAAISGNRFDRVPTSSAIARYQPQTGRRRSLRGMAIDYLFSTEQMPGDRIIAKWKNFPKFFRSVIGMVLNTAREAGRKLISFLSHNSPGPTREIPKKWDGASTQVEETMHEMAHTAQTTGGQITGAYTHAAQQTQAEIAGTAQGYEHLAQAEQLAANRGSQIQKNAMGVAKHLGGMAASAMALGGGVVMATQTLGYSLSYLGFIDEGTAEVVNRMSEVLGILGAVGMIVGPMISFVVNGIGAIVGTVSTAAGAVIELGAVIGGAISLPVVAGGLAVSAVVIGLIALFNKDFRNTLIDVFNGISTNLSQLGQNLYRGFWFAVELFQSGNLGSFILSTFQSWFTGAFDWVLWKWQEVLSAIPALLNKLPKPIRGVINKAIFGSEETTIPSFTPSAPPASIAPITPAEHKEAVVKAVESAASKAMPIGNQLNGPVTTALGLTPSAVEQAVAQLNPGALLGLVNPQQMIDQIKSNPAIAGLMNQAANIATSASKLMPSQVKADEMYGPFMSNDQANPSDLLTAKLGSLTQAIKQQIETPEYYGPFMPGETAPDEVGIPGLIKFLKTRTTNGFIGRFLQTQLKLDKKEEIRKSETVPPTTKPATKGGFFSKIGNFFSNLFKPKPTEPGVDPNLALLDMSQTLESALKLAEQRGDVAAINSLKGLQAGGTFSKLSSADLLAAQQNPVYGQYLQTAQIAGERSRRYKGKRGAGLSDVTQDIMGDFSRFSGRATTAIAQGNLGELGSAFKDFVATSTMSANQGLSVIQGETTAALKYVQGHYTNSIKALQRSGGDLRSLTSIDRAEISNALDDMGIATRRFGREAAAAIAHFDFVALGKASSRYFGAMLDATGRIAKSIGAITIEIIAFGVYAAITFGPMLLMMGLLGIAVYGLITDFLGIRTILSGLYKVAMGTLQALHGALILIHGTLDGIRLILTGIITLDFPRIKDGIFRIAEAWMEATIKIRSGFESILLGLKDVVRGVGKGIGQVLGDETTQSLLDRLEKGWFDVRLFFSNIADSISRMFFGMGDAIGKALVPDLSGARKSISSLSEAFQEAMLNFELFSLSGEEMGKRFAQSLKNGVSAGIAALIDLPGTIDTITANIYAGLQVAGNTIGNAYNATLNNIAASINVVTKMIGDFYDNLLANVAAIGAVAGNMVGNAFGAVGTRFTNFRTDIESNLAAVLTMTGDGLAQMFYGMIAKLGEPLGTLKGFIVGFFSELFSDLKVPPPDALLEPILTSFQNLFLSIQEGAVAVANAVVDAFKAITQPITSAIDGMKTGIGNAFSGIRSKFKNTKESIGQDLTNLAYESGIIGHELKANLAEASPGPTYWIRKRWSQTTNAVIDDMLAMEVQSEKTGMKLETNLGLPTPHKRKKTKVEHTIEHVASPEVESALALNQPTKRGAVNSLASAIGIISPGVAATIYGTVDAVSSIKDLQASLPTIMDMIKGGISGAGSAMMFLVGGVQAAIGSFGVLGAAIWTALAPIMPIILTIAAGAALIYAAWSTNFLWIQDIVKGVGNFITTLFGGIFSIFQGIANAIGWAFNEIWTAITRASAPLAIALAPIGNLFNAIGPAIQMTGQILAKVILLPLQLVGGVIEGVIKGVGWFIARMIDVGGAIANFANPFLIAFNVLKSISSLFSAISNAAGSFFSGIYNSIPGPIRAIIETVASVPGAMANFVFGGSGNTGSSVNSITPGIQQFAKGGLVRGPGTSTSDSIPALLSNNEYVLTADQVDDGLMINNSSNLPAIPFSMAELSEIMAFMSPQGRESSGSKEINVQLNLNFGDIIIQASDGEGAGTKAAQEFLAAIGPELRLAVKELLRHEVEMSQ